MSVSMQARGLPAVPLRVMLLILLLRSQMSTMSILAATRRGLLALLLLRWVVVVGGGAVTERRDPIRMEAVLSRRALQMAKMMSRLECGDATGTTGSCRQRMMWRTRRRLGMP